MDPSVAAMASLIREKFPTIDHDLFQYVQGEAACERLVRGAAPFLTASLVPLDVLASNGEDFESDEEVFEAIGGILQEVDETKEEEEIRSVKLTAQRQSSRAQVMLFLCW